AHTVLDTDEAAAGLAALARRVDRTIVRDRIRLRAGPSRCRRHCPHGQARLAAKHFAENALESLQVALGHDVFDAGLIEAHLSSLADLPPRPLQQAEQTELGALLEPPRYFRRPV